ncbi:hypoxia-inducible factor 1-alpha-like [Octopus sinensis]|uniref:Hypoxia-inducible factor 1-alpha-like n=1 Tax=Octopus sinensis TaxID=2607531 RepID=A0A6P7SKL8_9MOLL|nr:hypoxia-inducible factor 1-alpha-like [Octopus sinensis]
MSQSNEVNEILLGTNYLSLKPKSTNGFINKRSWRNYSEKLRRDKLNCYFEELAKCVPLVANSPQRLNKTSILRLSLSYLKFLLGLKRKGLLPKEKCKTELLQPGNVEELIGGFLLVITETGNLIYTSKYIKRYLGYNQIDVIGQSMYNLIHPDDNQVFSEQFRITDVKDIAHLQTHKEFTIRLNKKNKFHPTSYETFHAMGQIKYCKTERKIEMKEETWLIAILKPVLQPLYKEISIFAETTQIQYISRHDFNGRFLDITLSSFANDEICSPSDEWFLQLTGFNIKDVLGKSAYLFVHGGDMEYVAKAHKEMVEKNIVIEIVFRSTTKSQGIYFTSSRTFVIRDNWTEKPKMIIAVNHVISEKQGKSMLINQIKGLQSTLPMNTENYLQELYQVGICT